MKTISAAQLQREILAKRIQVVQCIPVVGIEAKGGDVHSIFTLDTLDSRRKQELVLRLAYVKLMLRKQITAGQRRKVEEALAKRDGEHPEIHAESKRLGIVVDESAFEFPSASTVMRWMRAYASSGGNPCSLVSGYVFRTPEKRLDPRIVKAARHVVRTFYLTKKRPTIRVALDQANDELQKSVSASESKTAAKPAALSVSMAALRNAIAEVSPYQRDKLRYGSAYAENQWRYSLGGVRGNHVMARYEVDHTILDIVVVHDVTGMPLGRPTITVIVDAASGYIVGMHISFWGAGLASVFSALKNAILPKGDLVAALGLKKRWLSCGIPDLMVVDNGLKFHSPHFHHAATLLNLDVLYCKVRQPWLKPMVERAIQEINRALPVAGRVEKRLNNYIPIDPTKSAAILFGDLCRGLVREVVERLHFEVNERTLELPHDVFEDGLSKLLPPRLPTSVAELDIIAGIGKTMTVGNEGIVSDYIRFNSTELQELRRSHALKFSVPVKINPEDLGAVFVQSPVDRRWLTVPSCFLEYSEGLSLVQHRAIRKLAKDRLSARNAEEELTRVRRELADCWNGAVKTGRRLQAAQLKAMEGLSSAVAWKATSTAADRPAKPVLAPSELLPPPKELETYELA